MKSKDFLAKQLKETAKIIEWAINLVPKDRLLEVAPHYNHPKASDTMKRYFGLWSAYRLLFHLTHYEEFYALPTMKHWLGESHPKVDIISPNTEFEKEAWRKELKRGVNLKALLERFHSVRSRQIKVLNSIQDEHWTEERVKTDFGMVSAEFTVTKTIQHTLEHGNKILRNALYWDRALEWLNEQ
ncbi:MAG: DinB family protein [Candidatus Methanofastidiosia archaeon]